MNRSLPWQMTVASTTHGTAIMRTQIASGWRWRFIPCDRTQFVENASLKEMIFSAFLTKLLECGRRLHINRYRFSRKQIEIVIRDLNVKLSKRQGHVASKPVG